MIDNINTYIESTEQRIAYLKSKNKRYLYDFSIQFLTDDLRENFKRYFENKNYVVEMNRCKGCNTPFWDVILSW